MATGVFSLARGIAGALGVGMSATFLEQRRERHAMQLSQAQGFRERPALWAMHDLPLMVERTGGLASMAYVKAGMHSRGTELEEATIAAYQDFLLASAVLSLFSILPGFMRQAAPKLHRRKGGQAA